MHYEVTYEDHRGGESRFTETLYSGVSWEIALAIFYENVGNLENDTQIVIRVIA